MQNIKLYYDDVSNEVFDANGKIYPIKEYKSIKQKHSKYRVLLSVNYDIKRQ